jgi:aromatic ring-opening dioxygenase catalytic subunit (LigB family)
LPRWLGVTPKAMLVVSGHWQEDQFTVTSGAYPPLLYDYHGFASQTYRLRYDAPGSPDLAQPVGELLLAAGFTARQDAQRGFDHGVFIPLKLVCPEAKIPVVQLSLDRGLDRATFCADSVRRSPPSPRNSTRGSPGGM